MRIVETAHSFCGIENYGEMRLDAIGLPLYDVFTARSASREIGYLIAGDAPEVLGALADKGSKF
jgi:hypothetical protein